MKKRYKLLNSDDDCNNVIITIFLPIKASRKICRVLFRCLPGMTYHNSKLILWVSLVLLSILYTIVFKYNKTEYIKDVAIITPYGIFTVIAYYAMAPLVINVVLILVIGVHYLYLCYNDV